MRSFCLAFALVLGLGALMFTWNLGEITSKAFPSHEFFVHNWQNPPLTEEEEASLSETLSRPFYYLAEGGQSFAFESEAKDYVLKLFKFHRFENPWYLSYLPDLPFISDVKEKMVLKREKRREKLIVGYKIAYLLNRKESGLFVVRLLPEGKERSVKLFRKDGTEETLDLGKTAFVIQQRGEPFDKVLSQSLNRGDLRDAKMKIDSILSLYLTEYGKGIYDRDHGVMHNVGFVGDRPLHLDVGEMVKDERFKDPQVYMPDLKKVVSKIKLFVKKHYPEYDSEISVHLDAVVESKENEKIKSR